MKKDALMQELREEDCFGELVAWIFVIEFQVILLVHILSGFDQTSFN